MRGVDQWLDAGTVKIGGGLQLNVPVNPTAALDEAPGIGEVRPAHESELHA